MGSEVTSMSPHATASIPSDGTNAYPHDPSNSLSKYPGSMISTGYSKDRSLSSIVQKMNRSTLRLFLNDGLGYNSKLSKSSYHRTCNIVGTMDGSLGIFLPVDERTYKRLNLLQHLMSMTLQSPCALNPKDYRLLKSSRLRLEKKKGVLDGTILWKFISLPLSTQEYLASVMGTTTDMILDNLYELNNMTQFM